MIPVINIEGKECWININYLVLTSEEVLSITNDFGIKQPPVHCWKMSFVNGDTIYISDEQKKLLTEPAEDK